jgi:hypothetical protein
MATGLWMADGGRRTPGGGWLRLPAGGGPCGRRSSNHFAEVVRAHGKRLLTSGQPELSRPRARSPCVRTTERRRIGRSGGPSAREADSRTAGQPDSRTAGQPEPEPELSRRSPPTSPAPADGPRAALTGPGHAPRAYEPQNADESAAQVVRAHGRRLLTSGQPELSRRSPAHAPCPGGRAPGRSDGPRATPTGPGPRFPCVRTTERGRIGRSGGPSAREADSRTAATPPPTPPTAAWLSP